MYGGPYRQYSYFSTTPDVSIHSRPPIHQRLAHGPDHTTPMRPNDAYTEFERTYSYPVDRETIIETMGDRRIESPTGDGETVAETLERAGRAEFTSPGELRDAFLSCLPEQYIGRKYYDDRGDNPHMRTPWAGTETGTATPTEPRRASD